MRIPSGISITSCKHSKENSEQKPKMRKIKVNNRRGNSLGTKASNVGNAGQK